METQPVVSALVAAFVALSAAGGTRYMNRATDWLRDLSFDPVVDPNTAAILRDILAAVDNESDSEAA